MLVTPAPRRILATEFHRTCKTGSPTTIGTLGAHLVALGGPDVQPAPQGRPRPQALELVDTHPASDRNPDSWQPRVLPCGVKNIRGVTFVADTMHADPIAPPVPFVFHASHMLGRAGAVFFCWRAAVTRTRSGRLCSWVLVLAKLGSSARRLAACAAVYTL
jgi:hypothetical protein